MTPNFPEKKYEVGKIVVAKEWGIAFVDNWRPIAEEVALTDHEMLRASGYTVRELTRKSPNDEWEVT
jgi:hypothetical protein